jgi:glycosyltransferase involved in cell wall biosynthesis
MNIFKNIYWINTNRFDEKIDKSTWLEISESLIHNKFSVTLLTGYRKKKWISKNYQLNIQYFKALDTVGLFKVSLNLLIFFWLLRNTKQNDIIIVSADALLLSVFLKKFKKCKIHLDIRTIPVEIHNLKNRFDRLMFYTIPLKLFKHCPDSYSFITKLLMQNIEHTFNMRFHDYTIWTSGVNSKHFAVARKKLDRPENKYILTYLGVVTKNRGIDKVLQAIGILNKMYKQKVLFQVIGDGPFLPNLKQMSSDLGITNKVLFKGYIPYDSVPEHLIDTDCFVCPLPDRSEWNVSSPLKVFEYLACGKPVILTPIVSHKNIIKNNEYIIWTQGDKVSDFVVAIQYAVKNRWQLIDKSIGALDYVESKYEWLIQGGIFSDYLSQKYNE